MKFIEAFEKTNSGAHNGRRTRITRLAWKDKGMWVRAINLYADPEFSVREHEPCDGTWMQFLVIKTLDNRLFPWTPTHDELFADDWIEVT